MVNKGVVISLSVIATLVLVVSVVLLVVYLPRQKQAQASSPTPQWGGKWNVERMLSDETFVGLRTNSPPELDLIQKMHDNGDGGFTLTSMEQKIVNDVETPYFSADFVPTTAGQFDATFHITIDVATHTRSAMLNNVGMDPPPTPINMVVSYTTDDPGWPIRMTRV